MKKLLLLMPCLMLSACVTEGGNYDRPMFGNYREVWVPVENVQPSYRRVSVAHPREVCQTVEARDDQNNIAGTLLGAVAGGVIGHQFGKGAGNAVATGAGAVAGAAIGNTVQEQNKNPPHYERRCTTVNDYVMETVTDGYDVTYIYNGQRNQLRTSTPPGANIKIRVDDNY